MSPQTDTRRVRRTWFERLKLWRQAYETKVYHGHSEAIGRGPTPAASKKAAEKRWLAAQSAEEERVE